MVLFQLSFLEKNSPDENSLFSLLNFLKVKPKVSMRNVAAPILLYNTTHHLTIIISNNKLNRIDTKINASRNLCVWCGFCASVTDSLAMLLLDCDVERIFWIITPLHQRRLCIRSLSGFVHLIWPTPLLAKAIHS